MKVVLILLLSLYVSCESLIPFSQEDAILWWNYASSMPCSASSITSLTCDSCQPFVNKLENITVIENPTTKVRSVVGIYNKEYIVVGYRGSTEFENWIHDIASIMIGTMDGCPGNCKVALGFYDAYLSIKKQLLPHIQMLKQLFPNYKLFFTGHISLYIYINYICALATVTVMDFLLNENITTHSLYTYGSPYVGNSVFASVFNKGPHTYYRITHYADPIVHLPPKSDKYEHVGEEVFYNKDSKFYKICLHPESSKCSNSVVLPTNFNDHFSYMNMQFSCPAAFYNHTII
ncbi:hypothetical protein WA158_008208 [Blastocystis sp. Blastoise]